MVSTNCIFKLKMLSSGQIDRCKSRLVAQGFTQREGVDFFAFFLCRTTRDTNNITDLAAILNLIIERVDFTTVFTQGLLKEDIFLAGIDGVEVLDIKVIKLN